MANGSKPFMPGYNNLIENDPMIVKVKMDTFEWGTRKSLLAKLTHDASVSGNIQGAPAAPEMTVVHLK